MVPLVGADGIGGGAQHFRHRMRGRQGQPGRRHPAGQIQPAAGGRNAGRPGGQPHRTGRDRTPWRQRTAAVLAPRTAHARGRGAACGRSAARRHRARLALLPADNRRPGNVADHPVGAGPAGGQPGPAPQADPRPRLPDRRARRAPAAGRRRSPGAALHVRGQSADGDQPPADPGRHPDRALRPRGVAVHAPRRAAPAGPGHPPGRRPGACARPAAVRRARAGPGDPGAAFRAAPLAAVPAAAPGRRPRGRGRRDRVPGAEPGTGHEGVRLLRPHRRPAGPPR